MMLSLSRRALLAATVSTLALTGLVPQAMAQGASERVRKIVLISWPQGANPQGFQASQLIAQVWRQLGLEIEIRSLPWQQHVQVVWNERERWDASMWRMVGRPERSDPDELVYNLFHSSTAPKGFNFVGYSNPEYDRIAEQQRRTMDQEKRRGFVREAQKI